MDLLHTKITSLNLTMSFFPLKTDVLKGYSSHPSPVCLTQFVFSWVVRDLHDVELQTRVALSDAVDAGDVGTRLVHRLHQLRNDK